MRGGKEEKVKAQATKWRAGVTALEQPDETQTREQEDEHQRRA